MIRLYLNVLFLELSRIYNKKDEQNIIYSHELVQLNRFETLVNKHFKEHKSLIFYADIISISLKQLSYLCKKVINKTPSEIILDRVILEAKRLVIHTDMSISSIANELNYNDNSYFIRFFKKVCNVTPEQYRYSFKSYN
jgi:AraC-like DNA-binding protein